MRLLRILKLNLLPNFIIEIIQFNLFRLSKFFRSLLGSTVSHVLKNDIRRQRANQGHPVS